MHRYDTGASERLAVRCCGRGAGSLCYCLQDCIFVELDFVEGTHDMASTMRVAGDVRS